MRRILLIVDPAVVGVGQVAVLGVDLVAASGTMVGGLDMLRHDVILPARREPQFDLDIEPFPEVRRRKPVRDWEQRERRRRK